MTDKLIALLPIAGCVFLLLTLSGCAGKTHIETIRSPLNIPPQMFQCEDAGNRPQGKVVLESQVARYIAGLEFSVKDCKTRLKDLSIVVKCYNDKDCNVDKLVEYVGLVKEPKQD